MLTIAIDARLVGAEKTGDSTYWSGLLEGWSQFDTNCRFLLFSNTVRPAGIPKSTTFEWITLPAKNSRWWSLVQFPLAARRRGARVLHTQYSMSPLVGSRGITTIHDVSFLIGPEWFKPKDRLLLTLGVKSAAKRAARILTVSETSREEIERLLPGAKGKTVGIPNACPSWIKSTPAEEARRQVAEQFGVTQPYVLTVGTRWPRKNMDLAVDAMELLPAGLPHRLLVTGKPGWGDQTVRGRALATGYVSNEALGLLYSGASLYLAPSLHEGFGIPVLEAFRCGCPVIASAGGALPEVVGDAGVVERSWKPADWARSIEDLLGDPSKLGGLRERGFARERLFSWEATARRTLDVYREVAG